MNEILKTIREITDAIADENIKLTSLQPEILEYSLLLRRTLLDQSPDFIDQRDKSTSSTIDSGVALSPWGAASCVDDRIRTAGFIRGAVRAVEHLLAVTDKRPLHFVEAGCGPLGALVIPLLAKFEADELEISVVDLHQKSIDSFRQMIKALDLSGRVRESICGDATKVRFSSGFDFALTETMCAALTTEPQVSIARALVRQNPDVILLPQSIRVDLTLIDWASELNEFPHQVKNRVEVGNIFQLNAKTALEMQVSNGYITASRLTIPKYAPAYLPSVTTVIDVFEDVSLSNYDSEITAPLQLPVNPDELSSGDEIQFKYRMGNSPRLEWTINRSQKEQESKA